MDNASTLERAVGDMADVILESLREYGDRFEPRHLQIIAGAALSLLTRQGASEVVASYARGCGRDDAELFGDTSDAGAATYTRIVWADLLARIDEQIPELDGSPRHSLRPRVLIVRNGRAVDCTCGCNEDGGDR